LLNHEPRAGVGGFASIIGGKLTTYRLMAAAVRDCVLKMLGVDAECTTDKVTLRSAIDRKIHRRATHLSTHPVAEKMERRLGPEAVRVIQAIE
jgi:glycerol-3-phosphate dehydrogenase